MIQVTRILTALIMTGILMTSCQTNGKKSSFVNSCNVQHIAHYVTCPEDTIQMMLSMADTACSLFKEGTLENLNFIDDTYNETLKLSYAQEIPSIVQLYATYDVVTGFSTNEANASFAWHEIAKCQMAQFYEKKEVIDDDIEAYFQIIDTILWCYDGGTQHDLNLSAWRRVMMADFWLISAYKNLFDRCKTPSLLLSVHGSYQYLFDVYSERYQRVTSMGHWSDQPRELASMMAAMMNEKRKWVENLQSRLEKGEITVQDVRVELDARPADTDDWETLDY